MTISHETLETIEVDLTIEKTNTAAAVVATPAAVTPTTLPTTIITTKSDSIINGDNEMIKKEHQHNLLDESNEWSARNSSSQEQDLSEDPVLSIIKSQGDRRVDKVYTIGCFDLFHQGHVILLKRMRELGKKVIVGVHDSESIYKLKKRVPIDSTEKRMLNVKLYADQVFCVPCCDPTTFMACIYDAGSDGNESGSVDVNETALYVRGDDMIEFPARKLVETLMPIKFLPYTQGVSSTRIRKQKYAHIASDDELYLQCNP